MPKAKTNKSGLIERKFETQSISQFVLDGNRVYVAYQVDERGMHRLCLVDDEGENVLPGCLSCYEHPCFAVFGMHAFIAVTEYYDGEPIQKATVYLAVDGQKVSAATLRSRKRRALQK